MQPDESARLAHAKKLLSKFQARQQINRTNDMHDVEIVAAPSSTTEQNSNSQPASIGTPSMEQTPRSSRSSSFVNIDQTGLMTTSEHNGQQSSSSSEVYSLRQALAEKEHHLNSTLTKLQALHGHYADLHQAYAELRSKQPDNSEFSQQIGQLQTALAIAVGEKTQLQTELRNANGHQKALEAEIEFLRSQTKGTINNAQLIGQQAENQQLHEKLANQSTTIAQQRQECAEMEAKIVLLNQDKNDIQARLKYAYQEKDEILSRLEELKKDLNIKEIYIRQLAKHSSADSTQGQQTIHTLTEQKNFFENECQRYCHDIALLKNEFEVSKRQYEECLAQSRAHATTLEQTIDQLANQKRQLEFSKFCMEEELQLLRKNAQENLVVQNEKIEDPVIAVEEPSRFDYEALNNSYQRMELESQRQTILIGQLNGVLEERDVTIEKLQNQTSEYEHRVQRLETQIQQMEQFGTDVSELLSQLQSERATVSRAVSQNMELKEQFGELQDKLIQMTNECARAEDEKVNAIALVNKLSRKIEELESGRPKAEQNDGIVQTDEVTEFTRLDQLNYSHIGNVRYPENLNDSNNSTSMESSSSATQETIDLSALHQQLENEEGDFIQDFLSNPKSSDSEFIQTLRNSFYKLQEDANSLRTRIETLEKLNEEYKQANDRLQYWLTSVESENESIVDFIEIYRAQRAQIQTRVAEKEEECQQLRKIRVELEGQVRTLHSSLLTFLKKSHKISDIDKTESTDNQDSSIHCDIHDLMRVLTQLSNQHSNAAGEDYLHQLNHTLHNASISFNPEMHCSECRGDLYDL